MRNKIFIPCLLVFVLICCRKEESMDQKAAISILGKWQLVNVTDEYYSPVNVLKDKDEYVGTPADSVIFKSNNIMYSYSPVSGEEQASYHLINGNTIEMDNELWKITKLTDKEFDVLSDETDVALGERYVVRIHMLR